VHLVTRGHFWRSVTSDMRHLGKTLTYLFTYLLTYVTNTAVTPFDLPYTSRLRKLSADRQTDRQTDKQIDKLDRNYMHHAASRVVKLHDANWTTGGTGQE